MSPEFQAIELMNRELKGDDYPNIKVDITKFLNRAQKELTPEDHEKFRGALLKVVAKEANAAYMSLWFGALFGSNIGLKADFNKFVGSKWKLSLDSHTRTAAALEAYVYEEPTEQSCAESAAAIGTDSSNEVSSLSADEMPESDAAPTSFAGIVPDPSPE